MQVRVGVVFGARLWILSVVWLLPPSDPRFYIEEAVCKARALRKFIWLRSGGVKVRPRERKILKIHDFDEKPRFRDVWAPKIRFGSCADAQCQNDKTIWLVEQYFRHEALCRGDKSWRSTTATICTLGCGFRGSALDSVSRIASPSIRSEILY